MNKVFSCADDLAVKIYYQGAGSIRLNYDDVDQIADRYKDKGRHRVRDNSCKNQLGWGCK